MVIGRLDIGDIPNKLLRRPQMPLVEFTHSLVKVCLLTSNKAWMQLYISSSMHICRSIPLGLPR